MPRIYDTFIFSNELDLLEIRLHVLGDVVDYFVLVESTRTFSGGINRWSSTITDIVSVNFSRGSSM